jgi:glycosyltransferase involved in cell wall biosynthesis
MVRSQVAVGRSSVAPIVDAATKPLASEPPRQDVGRGLERVPATDLPLVTIVTPSFNQGRWIRETLESVAAQTYPHVEHVVIDGGSTDETIEILRDSPGIRWVSEKDHGQADAINKGISMARGELIAFLNSDDLLCPDAVSTVVEHFRRDASVDLLYGDGTVIDEYGNALWDWLSRPEDFRLLADYHFLWNDSTNYILQQATFWRRSLHERIGFFDENFHFALDVDFWLRAGHAGAHMVHVPRKLAFFRMIQGTKSLSSPIVFWPDYLELFRRYHGARHIRRYVEQYLYEAMSKAGLSIDEAFSLYGNILDERWAGLEETERAVLRATGLAARGPALMLLADEAWHRGDLDDARRFKAAAIMYGRRALLRPRSIVHVLKAASGPAAPAVRGLWEWGVDSYRSRRYRARYRMAKRNSPESSR